MSSCKSIARPRPVPLVRRKISMEVGRGCVLQSPPEYSRFCSSEPNLHRLGTDLSVPISGHAGPLDSNGNPTEQTTGGSDPSLSSDILQPKTTTLQSPLLPPVFSALSDVPLQPQHITTTVPPSTNTSTTTNNNNDSEETDKYAALANLDAAFSDPTNMPATIVDWSNGAAQSSDQETDADTLHNNNTESTNCSSSTSQGHHVGQHDGGKDNIATAITTPSHDDDSELVDKYAAFADLDAAASTIDWGRSLSSDEESAAETSGPNTATESNNPFSAGTGVMSPCSPSPGPQTAIPPVMLVPGAQPSPVLTNTNMYYNPATQYSLAVTGQPAFGPGPFGNNVMYGYQQIPTHNNSCTVTLPPEGYQGFPAYMGMGSYGFLAHMDTGVAHIASPPSSNPFIASSAWPEHMSVCQS